MNSNKFSTPNKQDTKTTLKNLNIQQEQSTNAKTGSKMKIHLKKPKTQHSSQIKIISQQNFSQTPFSNKQMRKSLIKHVTKRSQKSLQNVKKRLFIENNSLMKSQLKNKKGLKLVFKQKQNCLKICQLKKETHSANKKGNQAKLYKINDTFYCIFTYKLKKLKIQSNKLNIYEISIILKQNGLIFDLVQDRHTVNQIFQSIRQIRTKYEDKTLDIQQNQFQAMDQQIELFYIYACLTSLLNYPIIELDYAYQRFKSFYDNSCQNIAKIVGVQIYRKFKQKTYENIKLNHFLKKLNK